MGKRGRPPKKKEESLIPSEQNVDEIESENEEVLEVKKEEVIEKPSFQKTARTVYRFKSNVIHGRETKSFTFKKGDLVKDNTILNEIEVKKFLVNGLLEEIKI